jgi:hypothetical protein
MGRTRRELDMRQKFDDGPGSLGVALPRGVAMGLRLYRLVEDGNVYGHTLEMDCYEQGTKVYVRLAEDGTIAVFEETAGGERTRLR